MFRQALNTVRTVQSGPAIQEEVLKRLSERIPSVDLDDTPAGVSQTVYEVVRAVTGREDPYAELKRRTNDEALQILPDLRELVDADPDPLHAAVRLAAAGNVIDFGIGAGHEFEIERDIEAMMEDGLAIEDIGPFHEDLAGGKRVLFLGDNSGEIVCDRVLVEKVLEAGAEVTFTVKSGPVINDATMADAEQAGLTGLVPVMETGSDDIGINWRNCSDAFREAYDAADIILSKGQGNYETISERPANIYYILKAKCPCVAEELGVDLGDIVFKHERP
jgi:hypothetical protein